MVSTASPARTFRRRPATRHAEITPEPREQWFVFQITPRKKTSRLVLRSKCAVTSAGSGAAALRSPKRHTTAIGSAASPIGTFSPSSSRAAMFVVRAKRRGARRSIRTAVLARSVWRSYVARCGLAPDGCATRHGNSS